MRRYTPVMKQKVGIFLERDVLRRAELHVMEERRTLSDLIQDALERYLSERMPEAARREAAYRLFCEQPMRLAPQQLKALLRHDR